MTEQLVTAIKERIDHGVEKQAILQEVCKLGYSEADFESAYARALTFGKDIQIPSIQSLVAAGVETVQREVTLASYLALSSICMVLPMYILRIVGVSLRGGILAAVVFLGALLVYGILMIAVLYKVGNPEKTISFEDAFTWGYKHIFSFSWLFLLLTLILWGGMLLLLIPAISLFVSTYFAQYIFVAEGKRGMEAIVASRALVTGRWFLVAKKIFGLIVVLMVPIIVVSIMLNTFIPPASAPLGMQLLVALITQTLSALVTVVLFASSVELYHALKQSSSHAEIPHARTYWLLSVVGVGFMVLIIGALFMVAREVGNSPDGMIGKQFTVESELLSAGAHATEYASLHDGSYVGVCGAIRSDITDLRSVVCNDTADAWALQVTETGKYWCVDKDEIPTLLQDEIGTSTTCK